jgi:adenylate cyclase
MELPDKWRALARALIGEPELVSGEIATRAGVPLEEARHLWRAMGFPPVADDERMFTRADLEMLTAVRALVEHGTPVEQVTVLTRVMGQSLARIADAQVSALDLGNPDLDVDAIGTLVQQIERFLSYIWRRHLIAALLRAIAAGTALAGARQVVGFVDLVGFTGVAEHLTAGELSELVERFEAHAYERIPGVGGRIVKTIGDAVMFAVDGPHDAAAIGIALVQAYAADPLMPDVRVGLAIGPTVAYEGDLFGQTVNLASRLVTLAKPGTVLVSDELGQALATDEAFVLKRLRARLKGIGRVRAWVLRPRPRSSSGA